MPFVNVTVGLYRIPSPELKEISDEYKQRTGVSRPRGTAKDFPEALAMEIADVVEECHRSRFAPEDISLYDTLDDK